MKGSKLISQLRKGSYQDEILMHKIAKLMRKAVKLIMQTAKRDVPGCKTYMPCARLEN